MDESYIIFSNDEFISGSIGAAYKGARRQGQQQQGDNAKASSIAMVLLCILLVYSLGLSLVFFQSILEEDSRSGLLQKDALNAPRSAIGPPIKIQKDIQILPAMSLGILLGAGMRLQSEDSGVYVLNVMKAMQDRGWEIHLMGQQLQSYTNYSVDSVKKSAQSLNVPLDYSKLTVYSDPLEVQTDGSISHPTIGQDSFPVFIYITNTNANQQPYPLVKSIGSGLNIYLRLSSNKSYMGTGTDGVSAQSDKTTTTTINNDIRQTVSSYDAILLTTEDLSTYVTSIEPALFAIASYGKSELVPTISKLVPESLSDYAFSKAFHRSIASLVSKGSKASVFRTYARFALPIFQRKSKQQQQQQQQEQLQQLPVENKLSNRNTASSSSSSSTTTTTTTTTTAIRKVAVIIENGVHGTFELSVRNVAHFLGPDWALVVFHSTINANYVRHALADVSHAQYRDLPTDMHSVNEYSKLLKSPSFWESLSAWDKCLIFQSDSVMLRSGIEAYLQYDYIGAAWNTDRNVLLKKYAKRGVRMTGVGNGGFSLRSVSAMLAITSQAVSSLETNKEQEDMFFSRLLLADAKTTGKEWGYLVAPHAVAYEFCKEVAIPKYDLGGETDAKELTDMHSQTQKHTQPQTDKLQRLGDGSVSHLAYHATWNYAESVQVTLDRLLLSVASL